MVFILVTYILGVIFVLAVISYVIINSPIFKEALKIGALLDLEDNQKYNAFITGIGGVCLKSISINRVTAEITYDQSMSNFIGVSVRSITGDIVIGEVVDQDAKTLIIKLMNGPCVVNNT